MTESNAVTQISTSVDGYFATRDRMIPATWSEDASYVDLMFAAEGPDVPNERVAGIQEQFPGHRFRQTGSIDAHKDRAWWGRELAGPDGRPVEVSGFVEQQTSAALPLE